MNLNYSELLKHPAWKSRRDRFLADHDFCQVCESKERLHVHHRTYKSGHMPWEYGDGDLRTLCEDCHDRLHRAEKEARAFCLGLDFGQADLFGQIIDELRAVDPGALMAAMANAKNAIRRVRHQGGEPRLIGDILADLASRQSTKILR